MTAGSLKKQVLHVPETGWTKSRQRRGKVIRTCIAAVENTGSQRPAGASAEWNIVQGED